MYFLNAFLLFTGVFSSWHDIIKTPAFCVLLSKTVQFKITDLAQYKNLRYVLFGSIEAVDLLVIYGLLAL